MADFRFDVGDLVLLRQAVADAMLAARLGNLAASLHGVIVERTLQECPGGVQKHYTLSFAGSLFKHNEIELASPAEFDAAKLIEAFVDGFLTMEKAKESRRSPADGA